MQSGRGVVKNSHALRAQVLFYSPPNLKYVPTPMPAQGGFSKSSASGAVRINMLVTVTHPHSHGYTRTSIGKTEI
jgi:hypothetical protein